jgi:outer membrane protein assembly complex protein YaeT
MLWGMRPLRFFTFLVVTALTVSGCKDEGSITVHRITFKGVHAIDQARLKQALATRENSKVPLVGWELPWSRKRYFDRTRFDADLQRIQAFYSDRGYPDARVTGFDVKLNAKQTSVDVTLTVSEGEPVRIASIGFSGFDIIPPGRLDTMKKQLPIKANRPRDRQDVVTAHEMALNELRDHGYPYARVNTDENDGQDGKQAAIVFTAEPGPIAHFGEVEIAGNKSVNDRVIERELTYKAGDLYRRSVVQNTQRRLYGLELFQFVNVELLNPDSRDPNVRTRVTVAEGKHQRLNFGVGYGTEEKGRLDAEYHHLNFLGGARSAGIHGRWSSLDRGLRGDFNQPYFLFPHFSLGGEAQQWYTFTPAYNSTVTGGKMTLTHQADAKMSWSVSLTGERDTSSISDRAFNDPTLRNSLIALGLDPTTLQQEGTLNALGVDFQRSTADNLLNAHRGYQIALHAEEAGRFLPGTFNYYSASADGRHYLPLGGNTVLASRLQVANIRPANNHQTNIPFSKKYFLGGASSIRGWGRFEVSPLSGSGFPVGGDSLLAVSEEVRIMLGGGFGLVLFVDAGNVWAESGGFKLGDLRYDVGPGLRYQTPVGPIRFEPASGPAGEWFAAAAPLAASFQYWTGVLTPELPNLHAVGSEATCTLASLKQAPPPRSVSVSGTSAVPVVLLRVLRRHRPFGRLTIPGGTLGETPTGQCTSPRSLKTRTRSPSSSPRVPASSGCMSSLTSGRGSSPSVELIVRSLAGEMSARGYRSVAGSGW